MELESFRQRVIDLHFEKKWDHLGSALSCLEIIHQIYFEHLTDDDRFVLSKGHAAHLWYCALAETGKLAKPEMQNASQPGGLPSHPPARTNESGFTFGTGSLGHGLSVAAGLALAKKIKNEKGRVFALLSDGECNEGSIWEAALFAGHHKLDNLTVIIDRNGLQGFGATEEVLSLEPLWSKWRSFGFETVEIPDGHDPEALRSAFAVKSEAPLALIARTVKGRGVAAYEGRLESHYFRLSKEDYLPLKGGGR